MTVSSVEVDLDVLFKVDWSINHILRLLQLRLCIWQNQLRVWILLLEEAYTSLSRSYIFGTISLRLDD